MNKYYSVTTDIGLAAIANATLLGTKVDIVDFVVGDGGGSYYQPTPDMKALRRQTWKGKVTSVAILEGSPNVICIRAILPSDVGGFTIREMGALDSKGQLFVISNTPDMQKVIIAEGVSAELEVIIEIAISNTEAISFTVDPTVILATKADIKELRVYVDEADAATLAAANTYTDEHSGGGKQLTASVTRYVAITGSDGAGDGTQEKPFRTLQKAVDVIPKNLGGFTAEIMVGDGVYQAATAEVMRTAVVGFYGGTFKITGNINAPENVKVGGMGVDSISQILIKGLEFNANTGWNAPLSVGYTDGQITKCSFDGVGKKMAGFLALGSTSLSVDNCKFNNCAGCVNAIPSSRGGTAVVLSLNSGANNEIYVGVEAGTIHLLDAVMPTVNTVSLIQKGGLVIMPSGGKIGT